MTDVHALTMPKWGLSMTEGRIGKWLVKQGREVGTGSELVEVETDKILSALEAPASGILRRIVAKEGDMIPVGGLLGVLAGSSVSESEVDTFVSDFVAHFAPEDTELAAASGVPEFATIEGFNCATSNCGQGSEEAILIHGFGGDFETWLFNHEDLASSRAVYAVDLPGHGGSSKGVGTGTPGEFRQVLAGFMDAVGLGAAHLVGHSMGGVVALDFALTFPERVLSLILIASAGLGPEIDGQYIDGFITASRRRDLQPHVEKLFANPKLITRQLIENILKYKRLDGVEAALRGIASQFFPGGRQAVVLRERMAHLPMPLLAIWGEEDRILPALHCQGLPGSISTEVLRGSGHMVQMEAAHKVNQLIREFWNKSGERA